MPDNRYLHLVRQDCPLLPGTHVVGYCRDSGGEEQERSTQQQHEAIQEYAEHHGLILDHIYSDDERKASNTDKRNALQDMLAMLHGRFKQINDRKRRAHRAKSHPFGIIFWKSNRLGRDSIETKFIKADLRLRGIMIIDLLNKNGTSDSGAEALLEAFQEWQDENFLDDLGANVSRGLADNTSLRDTDPNFRQYNPDWPTHDGRYLSVLAGTPPLGFKKVDILIGVRERKNRRGRFEKHYVQRIELDHENNLWERCYLAWKMRHEGQSIPEIDEATHLYKTQNSYTTFFTNRIYIGDLEYGGQLYEDFVEHLIPDERWYDEQVKVAARAARLKGQRVAKELEPRRKASRHLLTGLVYCGAVPGQEHPMLADTVPPSEKRTRWDFYICSVKKATRNKGCQCKRVSADVLNEVVIEKLMNDVLTRENLRPIADQIAVALADRNKDVNARIVATKGRIEEIQAAIAKLMDAIESAGMSIHLQKRLNEREAEERELLAELVNLEDMIVKPKDVRKVTNAQLDQFIASMKATLTGDDIELAKRAIRAFVAKIVLNGKAGTVYYTFPLQDITRNDMVPLWGFQDTPVYRASRYLVSRLYAEFPDPLRLNFNDHLEADRNDLIREKHDNGISISKLAQEFDLSKARVHQILHRRRN